MRDGQFLKRLRDLGQHMYDNPNRDFNTWKFIDFYSDNTGVFISLFDTGKEIIFSVRGTDVLPIPDLNDLNADRALGEGKIPAQYNSAEKYFNTLNYNNIIFTGYSLGGSICQLLGSKYGNETITFEAYGMADRRHGLHTSNILNFGNLRDPVFLNNIENQIGQVKIMKCLYKFKLPMMYHWYPFYGDPTNLENWNGIIPEHGRFPTTQNITNTVKNVHTKGKQLSKTIGSKGKQIYNRANDTISKIHQPNK